ncbi:hypothetical protein A2962_05135 [Candidatus Woesebacteria bacterium RIFCSPLOWO2_01_FULL_39_61]|uniref:Uncharacterized protein n=1 Tax=Candidatus Woesebacteria bacterium RIFCSPHIGHO2_02_FULL_39_13 TaxID=1802505 RepID=A0A1F7YZK4_9BACT|nr:MAG: hypothetical protein A2692_03385 [Candidatus Woesebacteria bacterium RIFCSPHIGHO2_01_FULL_39_95]OGM32650.1 MAG: hypothetical protein A3D01_05360 [Candidatus Woesebacteria bacterium RIFCSPHIGHO2_02_FULL_39_13]OGM66719.1 MAG: hypothetical protein A2962_05135 [Candidatus Woesebacteria bacterium RIFCSPLOWO2_01_FULL_39_61]OGM73790.1 MAG: hypothetical protein A3H19_02655 [Candidatus Woesebacteria bacterium RIFCSPLOWO2_12_FULL_39_9]
MVRTLTIKYFDTKVFIFIVIIIALFLRLANINQSLWLDEAIGAEAVKNYSYTGILSEFIRNDNHPPLYYLTLKAWTDYFGYSELALRAPSIIFGLFTIYLTYLISKKLNPGGSFLYTFLSTLFLATSQLHIYYSQEARMYSMAAFLASLTIYQFLCLTDPETKPRFWYLFSVSITALIFTDYLPVLLFPVMWIWAYILRKNKYWWRNFIAVHLPVVFFGILWMPIFMTQSQHGRWLMETLTGWKEIAGGATFKQIVLVWIKFSLGRISFSNRLIYYSVILLSSIPISIALLTSIVVRRKIYFLWMWLLIPLFSGLLLSLFFPAFIYFRFLYLLPAFYLIVAFGISSFHNKLFVKFLTICVLVINIFSWMVYIQDEYQQREQWRGVTSFVEKNAKNDEVAIFEYPEPFTPYRWYATGKVLSQGVTDSISANREKTYEKTQKTIRDRNGVYYFEYLSDISDPNKFVEEVLIKDGFIILEVYNFIGVGQVFYWVK